MSGGGIGPQIPPEVAARLGIRVGGSNDGGEAEGEDPLPASDERRTIGPTMPPATGKQPPAPAEDRDGSGDEDDGGEAVGPAVELAGCTSAQAQQQRMAKLEAQMEHGEPGAGNNADGRGEWMLVPPTRDGSGRAGGDGLFDESWTLTPEEKAKRLAKQKEQQQQRQETPGMRRAQEEDAEKAKWVDEFNRTNRPKSLMELHLESKQKSHKGKQRSRDARARGPADDWKRARQG
ncbi:hypothetical protein LPJ61_001281, partial [Coemansia biformis]